MSTATLLAMPRAVFYDSVGNPLAGGLVHTYVPGGSTPKTTWQDSGETTPNSNPIVLDADGSCLLYGSGNYQITVTDALGNAIPGYSGLSADVVTEAGISAAMAPVVAANSTTAALGLLGLTSTTDATLGSALVGFFRTPGGFVGRTVESKLGDIVSVTDFGADPTGVSDSSTAFNAAVNASLSVYIPAGTYRLASGGVTLRPGSTIKGAGMGAATINIAANSNAFSLLNTAEAEAHITISDMTINSLGANTNGIWFRLCDTTVVQRVRFSGLTGNVLLDRGRWHTIEDCVSCGNTLFQAGQLQIHSSTDTEYVFYPTLENYQVNCGSFDSPTPVFGSASPAIYVRRAIQASLQNCAIDHAETTVGGCNFILLENDCQGTKIIGGSSHGCTTGILIQTGAGPTVGPGYTDIISHDVDLFSVAGINVNCNSPGVAVLTAIIGGKITAPTANGVPCIHMANVLDGSMTAVHCEDYSGSKHGTGLAISSDVTVNMSDCIFDNLNIGWDFSGGSLASCSFANNSITNCTTEVAGGANIAGGANAFNHNRGADPPLGAAAPATPAVPPTTGVVSNNSGFDVMIYPVGGTGVTWSVNGAGLGASAGPFYVPANGFIQVNYTTAPTWTWIGV